MNLSRSILPGRNSKLAREIFKGLVRESNGDIEAVKGLIERYTDESSIMRTLLEVLVLEAINTTEGYKL